MSLSSSYCCKHKAVRNTTIPKNVFCVGIRVKSMWTKHLEELDFGSNGSILFIRNLRLLPLSQILFV